MGPSEPGSASPPTESVDPSRVVLVSSEQERSRPHLQVWAMVLSAAVAAGLISWLGGEATYGSFKPRLFSVQMLDGSTVLQPSLGSQRVADTRNAALACGIQGAVLVLAMGLAGGLASRSTRRGVVVGVAGAPIGALAGALAAYGLFPVIFRDPVPNPNDLMTPMMVRAGIWSAIGAVAGIAFAMGFRSDRRLPATIGGTLVGALLGAFLATLLHGLLHGVLSTPSGPTTLIGNSARDRLMAVSLMSLVVAAGAVKGSQERMGSPTPSAPAR